MKMTITRAQAQLAASNWPEFKEALKKAKFFGDSVEVELPENISTNGRILQTLGLGDIIARTLHRFGFREWSGCHCSQRREWLNHLGRKLRLFP